jgi:DNA-binding response OmpR family regulator
VFKLLFPAAAEAQPSAPGASASRPEGDPDGATVLVVDDEDEIRSVVVMALRRAGFQTVQARDGMEALNLFQRYQERIRLILMDLTMPTMDGEEACRELRRRGSTVPVILSSGFNEVEALRRFDGLGLTGFIQKPFSLGTLVQRVRSALAG